MSETNAIESVAALLHEVSKWECENLEPETAAHGVWYRGQADKIHDLLPGIERPAFMDKASKRWPHLSSQNQQFQAERMLNEQFVRLSASIIAGETDLVRIYFLAQHYGLPTRLLDWTTNPLAALFFACEESKSHEGRLSDGRLFVVKYDQIGNSNPRPPVGERRDEVRATVEFVFGKTDVEPGRPAIVPVLPALHFPRMMRQGSCFTLHMPGAERLTSEAKPAPVDSRIRSYDIPAGVKRSILAQLRCLGVAWSSLFSDLEYLVREVKESL